LALGSETSYQFVDVDKSFEVDTGLES
jgi:hypothetical protein